MCKIYKFLVLCISLQMTLTDSRISNKIQVNKAKCFLKLLSSKDVILYMHLLLEVCEPLKKLSATQQDKTAAVSDIHRILHSTLAVLKKIKSTQVFLCFLFPYLFFFFRCTVLTQPILNN